MPKTFILIRCTEFSDRVGQMIKDFNSALPGWTVIPVVDCTGLTSQETTRRTKEFPVQTYAVTDQFITEKKLHHAHEGAKTGWLCGDYVFYRVIDLDWDFAWIVEPDLYFLNGAERTIEKFQKFDHDLVATHLWPSGEHWMWGRTLLELMPDSSPHAMAFPFCRISKRLARRSMEFRQSIAESYKGEGRLPNDEVVVATAAYESGMSTLDIGSLLEETFRYWSTVTRVSVDDLQESTSLPLIVHSGQPLGKFQEYMKRYLSGALDGSDFCREQLLRSLATASKETILRVLEDYVYNGDKAEQSNLKS